MLDSCWCVTGVSQKVIRGLGHFRPARHVARSLSPSDVRLCKAFAVAEVVERKVLLDSACCLPTAAGLAAGKAVGEEGEESDDALFEVAR